MIITKAMPPQTATTGVSHPIAAGQGITSGLCGPWHHYQRDRPTTPGQSGIR